VEKEKSFQVSITEGLGKRNIEIAKTPRLTELLKKALSRDLEHITPLTQGNYRNKLNLATEKAGNDIPEKVKITTQTLRAAGIHGLIDKGFCREDVEAYTGSSNSGFIEKLFEQHRQESVVEGSWKMKRREAKTYINEDWEWNSIPLNFWEKHSKMPEGQLDDPWARHGRLCRECGEAFYDTEDRGICHDCWNPSYIIGVVEDNGDVIQGCNINQVLLQTTGGETLSLYYADKDTESKPSEDQKIRTVEVKE